MGEFEIIDLNPDNIATYGVCGYKDVNKNLELRKKIEWINTFYPKGLRIKIILADKGGYQGMLEYIPGEYAHRPVEADGYMFIHCVFVGFRKEYKGKGLATALIEDCIHEAQNAGMKGVAVITRKGSFMVDSPIFEKLGFVIVDKAKPDFCLMVKKFVQDAENPIFKKDMQKNLEKFGQGLTIMRSPQCPYTEKNVNAIIQSAQNRFHLEVNLLNLDANTVQESPSPFGTFCLIYEGKVISHHPISNTRFINIMEKILK